jgi:PEP-CTERM motif
MSAAIAPGGNMKGRLRAMMVCSIRPVAAAVLCLGVFLFALPVSVSFGTVCGSIVVGQTCGETLVGGSGPSDPAGFVAPHILFDFAGAPNTSSSAGGSGSVSGTATATADFGLLRATAVTSNFYPLGTVPLPLVAARSIARFIDAGPVSSVSLVTGTPVLGRFTLDVDGSFSGDGESPIQFLLVSNLQGRLVDFSSTLLVDRPSIFEEFDVNLRVGEMLQVFLELHASANAGNSERTMVSGSSANVGQSAHLNLDFMTAGVSFAAGSGHDYSLSTQPAGPVPEPTTLALLGTGALCLFAYGLVRRKRSG